MNLAQRVAARYQKQGSHEAEVQQNLVSVVEFVAKLQSYGKMVADLIAAGERRRIGRVSDIRVGAVSFDGSKVEAKVQGTTGVYATRITVAPKRGHHCTCPDWIKNGPTIGPCKHVLALGLAWKEQRLDPVAVNTASKLEDIAWQIM